ncbi:FAD-dependent oxidoreductase [Streptomyces sp. NBC_01353]|uniref:FAD-dependent oxidoreductase n=1 Tax=Streptomyces sp. NBC_01353 TaxID=2903835 RepID=UPI002E30E854|nr:FAD-dependent oxidoreductase [Streptomyces sp. NBC_01353]
MVLRTYLGASAAPVLHPGNAPTAGALRFLLDAGLGQLHDGLTGARIDRLHHGNRPVGLDGHPLLGNAGRPGLRVATGTHRDGLHASPLIAQEIAAEILHGTPSPWPAPWQPGRKPIATGRPPTLSRRHWPTTRPSPPSPACAHP